MPSTYPDDEKKELKIKLGKIAADDMDKLTDAKVEQAILEWTKYKHSLKEGTKKWDGSIVQSGLTQDSSDVTTP